MLEMRWASSCGMLGGVSKGGQIELLWQQRGDLMTQRARVLFKTGWISLAIISVAILVFGLIALARRRVNVVWAMLRDGTTFENRSAA